MNGLPYYKAYPRDFIEGTIGMPFEIKGAYRLILDLIYMQGGGLPDDARYISGHLGCSIRKWSALRESLIEAGKIYVSGTFLRNYRADKELETLTKLQDKQRENRSRPNKNNSLASPPINHTEPDTDTDKKETGAGAPDLLSNEDAPKVDPVEEALTRFYAAFPKRKDGKYSTPAAIRPKLKVALKKTKADELIRSAEVYAASPDHKNGEYAMKAVNWLRDEEWQKYLTSEPAQSRTAQFLADQAEKDRKAREYSERAAREAKEKLERRERAKSGQSDWLDDRLAQMGVNSK